jgi:predicted nucleic-acid-binding Zn-ribbon protein
MLAPTVSIDQNDDELICPKCGGLNLHHETIEVYTRPKEDGEVSLTLITHSGRLMHNGVAKEEFNPSPRQDGLRICFSCETCGNEKLRHKLIIFQHKGTTYLRWEI